MTFACSSQQITASGVPCRGRFSAIYPSERLSQPHGYALSKDTVDPVSSPCFQGLHSTRDLGSNHSFSAVDCCSLPLGD